MRVEDYVKIISLSTFLGFLIFALTNNIVIGIITGIIIYWITSTLRKKVKKHDIKIDTQYIKESYEELDNENNYCTNCGNKVNSNVKYCKKCGNEIINE